MPTLRELIEALDDIPDGDPYEPGPTIFARTPWSADSDALVLNESAIDYVAPSAPDYTYLLEVDLARDAIEVWSAWRDGASPSLAQAVQAVIFYAEHDSYQPVA